MAPRRRGPCSFELGAGRIGGALVWPRKALESAPTTPFRSRSAPPAARSQMRPDIHACELFSSRASLPWIFAAGINLGVL